MQTSRMRVLPGVLSALVLSILPLACGGGSKGATSEGKADAKASTPADATKAPDVKAADDAAAASADAGAAGGSGGPAGEAGDAGTGGTAGGGGTGGAEAGSAAAGSGGAGADETAAGTGGGSGGDEAGETGAVVDTKALLKEIKSKRTKDDRLQAALAEAEAAGVESLDVAKALNTRGEALFATPEKAKATFELALEKDATYPNPAFNLAKQAANLGELDEAKKWLAVVKERKGKKLLKQIEFDPMWEILKDDPDVRALLR